MKSLASSQQSIRYLDLTGNQLGGSEFQRLVSEMPRDLEYFLIANNKLENSNLRAISQTIRVNDLLDITRN